MIKLPLKAEGPFIYDADGHFLNNEQLAELVTLVNRELIAGICGKLLSDLDAEDAKPMGYPHY